MSALPKQVQAQIDEANRILEIMNQPIEKDEAGNPKLDKDGKYIPIKQDAPPADPPAADAAPPADPPVVAVTPPADPAPVLTPEEESMEHKYKVLQGKYNAEVPKLSKDLKDSNSQLLEIRQRLNNTESLLAGLSATRAAEPAAAPSEPTAPAVSEEEIKQFGPDLIDLIGRVAESKVIPQLDARIKPIDNRFDSIEETASKGRQAVAESERLKLMTALTEAIPEWETQNEEPAFLQWLNENDVYAGVPRGALLTQAFRTNDVPRVIAFFKGFQTENAVVAPEGEVTPPAIPPEEPQQALVDLVAPGTPKTGTIVAPDESGGKRIWTRADISAFYAKRNEFITRGLAIPEEYDVYERDLFAAQNDGRVRP